MPVHKGAWIRQWREYQNPRITQARLAELITEAGTELSRSAIGQYESEISEPKDSVLRAIERIFGVQYPKQLEEVRKNIGPFTGAEGVSLEALDGERTLADLASWGDLPTRNGTFPPKAQQMEKVSVKIADAADALITIRGNSLGPTFQAGDRVYIKESATEAIGRWNVCEQPGAATTLRWVDETSDSPMVFDTPGGKPLGPTSEFTFYGLAISMERNLGG